MKRTPLKRRTTFKKKHKKPKKVKKLKEHFERPAWFIAIKPGSHGSGPDQKRLWRVTSEKVRQEDFEKYGGRCVSCPRILESWKVGQCGHYKAWGECNGFFKFERKILALQCPHCNMVSDGFVNAAFREELERRYGADIHDWIAKENQKHAGEKLDVIEIVKRAADLLGIQHSL